VRSHDLFFVCDRGKMEGRGGEGVREVKHERASERERERERE
jgi:hypothetical protein